MNGPSAGDNSLRNAGGTLGNSVDQQRGTIYHSESETTTSVVVNDPPPPPAPPQEVITVQPEPAAVWIYGFGAFAGDRYAWVPGHWEVPPPRCRMFVAPHWRRHRGSYVYIQGYWR
jgi:hypothetical protein